MHAAIVQKEPDYVLKGPVRQMLRARTNTDEGP